MRKIDLPGGLKLVVLTLREDGGEDDDDEILMKKNTRDDVIINETLNLDRHLYLGFLRP